MDRVLRRSSVRLLQPLTAGGGGIKQALVGTLSVLLALLSLGSISRQMSFEEVTLEADLVVLGEVTKVPAFAVNDKVLWKGVVTFNTVTVLTAFKGQCASTIVLGTYGGATMDDPNDGTKAAGAYYSDQPQLPPVGAKALLFLKPVGDVPDMGQTYKIYSATHGVVPVKAGPDGRETVKLLFRNPALMPQEARRLLRAEPEQSTVRGAAVLLPADVRVDQIKDIVDKLLAQAQPEAPR